jgi:GntR family transcriptional regulator/MocR family aminotransferase
MARGARCDARQVYIVNSAQRGLELVCRLLLEVGDAAAVEDPGYPGAWSALASAGARVVPVPVDPAGLDVQALAARRGVRLVYVTPSHQFPLGVRMTLARRRALVAWAAANAGWIVEDDYDSEFRFDAGPLPCLQGLDALGRVIYIGTFSKSVFPALRIGFVIAPPDLHDHLMAVRLAQGDPQPPFLEQAILADFIAQGHFARHLRRMHALYAERLSALEDGARRWCSGLLALRPTRTGLHAVGELGEGDADRVCDEAARRGLELAPISAYAWRAAARASALVLGFGAVAPAGLDRGMQELASAIETARRTRAA